MRYAGLDVGSRTTKLVVLDGQAVRSVVVATGINPLRKSQELLAGETYDSLLVTGYGRHLIATTVGVEAVSEITAHAAGARYLYPDCRMVIDVGGQDSKVILLAENGAVQKFAMNDRCAAGTGKFLEIMAGTLEVDISMFGNLAQEAAKAIQINSLCTVFAESEVVSLVARGEQTASIAKALHEAVATRLSGMVRQLGPITGRVVFAGGVARNTCMRKLLGEKLNVQLNTPDDPQITGALGAALLAERTDKRE